MATTFDMALIRVFIYLIQHTLTMTFTLYGNAML